MPEVIAEAAMAIVVELAELILPLASTLNEATALAEPKSPAEIEIFVASVFAFAKAALAYEPAELAVANAELP